LEELERLLAPPPKPHPLFIYSDEPSASTYEERLAAFKVEHDVQPHDKLFVMRIEVVER